MQGDTTMTKTVDETLLPRPPQLLDSPAMAQAVRRAAERLEEQFRLSSDAANAFATAVVDPSDIRKAAEKPEELYVPGGTLFGLRTRVWARRTMPDPRNPRVGPARRHPAAVPPGSTEDARFRPIPEPDANADGRPELELRLHNREHLSWASAIAKKYILKDNDWRLSIRNQGVMTEVWLSAVTLVHEDDTVPVTVPVTSEGSSRLTAVHDILDIRSADVPYARDDRALRSIIRSLNDAYNNGPSAEQAEALRCETLPALLLVGFAPNPGSTMTFAGAVRSLVALRHVDAPKEWDPAATMESIADFVLETLAGEGLITPGEELWLAGALTPQEAEACGFSADPAVRAARIVRLMTDDDPSIQFAVRVAITSQSTRKRITNKFKLQVAAALIMRSVTAADERGKVADIHRALRDGFSDTLATQSWQATYRPTDEVVAAALEEVSGGRDQGPNSLELAARAAYPFIVSRQLFPDRGTQNSEQPDRRNPGLVIERLRTSQRGVRQLGQALIDQSAGQRIRVVDDAGTVVSLEDGSGPQVVSDTWLRTNYPPPGKPVAPAAPETAHERLLEALSRFGRALEELMRSTDHLARVEGLDGRPLVDTEGVDPADGLAWSSELMRVFQLLPVWQNNFAAKHGSPSTSPTWDADVDVDDLDEYSTDDEDDELDADVGDLDEQI
jgi:hypothetical protein